MKRRVNYAVIDAFTSVAFKGNPAAVCLLEEGGWDTAAAGDSWMKSVAAEFNISETCFLTRVPPEGHADAAVVPRFRLRWFTPVEEVDLCGHATLAAAHFLFKSSLAECNQVEFITRSGVLTAKKICGLGQMNGAKYPDNGDVEQFSIELDFPVVSVVECHSAEVSLLPGTLKGVSVVDVKKTAGGDLLVELDSGKDVANIQPQFDEIRRCAGRGLIVTGPAPDGSGFDIFSRFFCPKLGINEDPVCGSAHCVLAPYWRRKIGKSNLIAYMASPRGGRLDLLLEEETQRVKIRGEAVTVMVGTLLA
ncbi:hypothetical protein Taro_051696 [Colocasia esculenta]|uniref:Uncharacterized protein n=1 Tax=Colocasia esculenta TaxID=4460 RepID=A0A843XHL4_COLES|nr:hypothetical protein [Colocasia esculenta]